MNKVLTTIMLPDELKEELSAAAERQGKSLSQVIEPLLVAGLVALPPDPSAYSVELAEDDWPVHSWLEMKVYQEMLERVEAVGLGYCQVAYNLILAVWPNRGGTCKGARSKVKDEKRDI